MTPTRAASLKARAAAFRMKDVAYETQVYDPEVVEDLNHARNQIAAALALQLELRNAKIRFPGAVL